MSLEVFFTPSSVAVVGASRDPKKIGHVIFRNLVEGDFRGRVYPVNPNAEEIFQRRAYANVNAIPGPVDLAVICVPAQIVPHVMEECARKGVKGVVVITAGFREVGNEEGEKRIVKTAKRHGIRVMGPNCLGVFDPYSGFDTFFHPRHRLGRPKAGAIAFISQSGAVASIALDLMDRKGYRTSKFISYGNAADIDEEELIEFLARDKKTRVICAYFEGLKDGRRFMKAARKCPKPIVVLKGGVSEKGSAAVVSHTGSLAGAAEVYAAAFKQSGVIQANGMEQIFNFGRVFAASPKPKGKRVQIITNGGGFGILTVDSIVENGLELAQMDKQTLNRLKKIFPAHTVVKNPLDLTGDATAERYRIALDAALNDPNVDMIIVIALLQIPTLSDDIVDVITEAWSEKKKPIFVVSAGGEFTEVLKKTLDEMSIPTFSWPKETVETMRALWDYSRKG